jgi:hypothetical protein
MSEVGGFVAGSIVAKLLMDKTGWDNSIRDIQRSQGSLAGITRGIGEGFIQIGKMAAIAGVAAAGALTVMVKKTAEAGDQLYELSQKTGVSVELLSSYKLATEETGSSLEGLAIGIRFLSRNMLDASRGIGLARTNFQELGISTASWGDQLPPINEMILTLADRFSGMADGAEKSALMIKIFGRSGTELIPFFNLGSQGLKDLAALAEKLGVVFTAKTAKGAHEFIVSMKEMDTGLQGVRNSIANALIPVANQFVRGLTDALVFLRGKIDAFAASGQLANWATETARVFIEAFKLMVRAVEGLMLVVPTVKAVIGKGLAWTQDVLAPIYEKLSKLGPDEGLSGKWKTFFKEQAEGARGASVALKKGADENIEKASDVVEAFDVIIETLNKLKTGFGKAGDEGKQAGAKIATAFGPDLALKTKLHIEFKSDVAEKIADITKALKIYGDQPTEESFQKLHDALIALEEPLTFLKDEFNIITNADIQRQIDKMTRAMAAFQGQMNPETLRRFGLALEHVKDDTDYLRTELGLTFISDIARKIDDITLSLKKYSESAGDAKRTLTPEDVRRLELQLERLQNPLAFLKDELGVTFGYEIKRKIGDITLMLAKFQGQMTPDQITALQDALVDLNLQLGVFGIKWGDLWSGMKSGFSTLFEDIITGAKKFSDFWKGFWNAIKSAFAKVLAEMVADYVTKFIKQILIKTGLLKAIDSIVGAIFGGVVSLFGSAGKAAASALVGGTVAGAAGIGGAAGETMGTAALGGAAAGTAALSGNALLTTAAAGTPWGLVVGFVGLWVGTLVSMLNKGKKLEQAIYNSWDKWHQEQWDKWVATGGLLTSLPKNVLKGGGTPTQMGHVGSYQAEEPVESLWSILGLKTAAGKEASASIPFSAVPIIDPHKITPGGGNITVNVNINGQVITDRDWVRGRLLPEITDAFASNVFRRKVQLALGVGRG